MKALLIDGALRLETRHPEPAPAAGEHLVRVQKAGICNTDLEIARGYMGFRGIPGHEFVGIAEDGAWAGKRVAGEINVACHHCEMCSRGHPTQCPNRTTIGIDRHDGVFAGRAAIPAANLHLIPNDVSDDQAVFVEPLAAALRVTEITPIRPTDRVVLLGTGKLGLLAAQVAALTGCSLTAVSRYPRQRELLAGWGIESAAPGEVEPRRADIIIDCTGTAEGFADALKLVRPLGTIHLKSTYHGLPQANLTQVVVDEITIAASRCGPFEAAISLLQRGLIDVESLIEARYPLDEGLQAFEHAGRKGALKVILDVA